MVHIHGPETLLAGIRPPHCSMNHHGSGYYDHILDLIICYPILMVTYHSTVNYSLDLAMQLFVKLLGIVYTIICGLALHYHSFTHGFPIKL